MFITLSLNWKVSSFLGFPCSLVGKESASNTGDPNLIPELGRWWPGLWGHQGPFAQKTIFPQTRAGAGLGEIRSRCFHCDCISIVITSAPPQSSRC